MPTEHHHDADERAHLIFWRNSSQTNRLTPHPGPLPFKGRGCTTSDPGVSNLVPCVRAICGRAVFKGSASSPSTKRVRRTPSALNGERAGVRGEDDSDLSCNKLRCAPDKTGRKTVGASRTPTRDGRQKRMHRQINEFFEQ